MATWTFSMSLTSDEINRPVCVFWKKAGDLVEDVSIDFVSQVAHRRQTGVVDQVAAQVVAGPLDQKHSNDAGRHQRPDILDAFRQQIVEIKLRVRERDLIQGNGSGLGAGIEDAVKDGLGKNRDQAMTDADYRHQQDGQDQPRRIRPREAQ